MALLAYNRKKQFLAPYVEPLIKHLTGFEEDEQNYQEVANFVYTNIIHHNFATVDIKSVQKSVEGIAQKFQIHGLNRRGKRFLELVNKYVSSDSSHHTQLNVQWNVLLLLLRLAYRPLSVSENALQEREHVPDPSEPEEDIINWTEYLKDGWEKFRCPSTDSNEDNELWMSASDDEGEEPPAGTQHSSSPCDASGYGTVPHPSLWGQTSLPLTRQVAVKRLFKESYKSEQWLYNNVQNSWWNDPSCKSILESAHSPAHVFERWDSLMAAKNGNDSSSLVQVQVISEFKVLHEILLMMQVPMDTSLFQMNDAGQFCVNPNLSLPSTIPSSLQSFLEGLCPYFNMINKLRKFDEELSQQEMSDNPPPVTYKAYCAALFQLLHNFNKILIDVETRLNKQEVTMTLVSVMEELSPGLSLLQYLYDVHSRAVTDWLTQPPWLCTTRLLSVLYEALLEATDQMCLEASLNIFMHSFHVYLYIIDVWLSEGRLEDWRREFLIIREENNLEVMPYEEEMRACGIEPVSLLSKLVTVVRDAGRTMEVVSQLNKLGQLREAVQNKGCLSKEFSANVYSELKRLKENIEPEPCSGVNSEYASVASSIVDADERLNVSEDEAIEADSDVHDSNSSFKIATSRLSLNEERKSHQGESKERPSYQRTLSSDAMYKQTMRILLDNPLLTEALSSFSSADEPDSQHLTKPATVHPQPVHRLSLVGLMSMHSVLEKQLELVTTRHRTASRLVTQTLRTEYSLLQHFTVLRTVFFMEAGNLAQSFYSYLFREIESGVWNNAMNLTVQLQVCVEEFYPGFGNYFAVLVNGAAVTADVHQAIPSISLAYRVDWPVSLVINEDTIESYNRVFRFLLHLKYAFWTLHNIRFSDLYGSPNTLRVRRLHVLKLWMYHSTNTLHAYFMGLVLRSFSTHLEQSIRSADSIHLIVQAHNKFLDEVKIHCLQQDKKTYVEIFIMKLLRLCSSLSDHWQMEAAGTLTDNHINTLEEKYLTLYRTLVHCLEVVTSDVDAGNFLSELKNELSHSEPEPRYV